MMGFENKDRLRKLMDKIESASSGTGQKVERVAQEAAVLFNANTPGQCVDATRWIADRLNKLGIKNQERTVNIPFDASKKIEAGDSTTSHTILEAIFDDALWVIDTQLMQFTLPERNKLRLPEGFVFQYVYQASDYYDKVPAFSDSMCIEKINSAIISLAVSSTGAKDEREASTKLKVFDGFEAFINLRKARDLFERLKSVVDIRESERFRHTIPLLLAEKERLKNPDEPGKMLDPYYRYPSNCRPCSVHVMRILKKFHFKAELRTVEFPKEIYPDLDIDRHSFVVTEIGGKEFIIDIAADQFEPLDENKWADLGVVVLPVDVVNQYPARFWMYTGQITPADSSARLLKQVIPAAITRTEI